MLTYKDKLHYASIILVSLVIAVVLVCLQFLNGVVIKEPAGIRYELKAGATLNQVVQDLHEQHIIRQPLLFKVLIYARHASTKLKAGEYLFIQGSTSNSILTQLINNSGLVLHSFTIVPGMTFRQMRNSLNRDPNLKHTLPNLTDKALMEALGSPVLHPEGQFFPDTYYYVAGINDVILLKRAYQAMQGRLMHAWNNRAANIPFNTPYELLIAASIIEKEAYLNSEKSVIAGVMVNRLKWGIILQFDPTVIYGMGTNYKGVIYRRDLLSNNPYNTYVHKGLPPTPISMPGAESLEAVAHPDANNYLYFVATGNGTTHHFSSTLAEHYAAVAAAKKYHPWQVNGQVIKQYLDKILKNGM